MSFGCDGKTYRANQKNARCLAITRAGPEKKDDEPRIARVDTDNRFVFSSIRAHPRNPWLKFIVQPRVPVITPLDFA
jgi:hypothetical protein